MVTGLENLATRIPSTKPEQQCSGRPEKFEVAGIEKTPLQRSPSSNAREDISASASSSVISTFLQRSPSSNAREDRLSEVCILIVSPTFNEARAAMLGKTALVAALAFHHRHSFNEARAAMLGKTQRSALAARCQCRLQRSPSSNAREDAHPLMQCRGTPASFNEARAAMLGKTTPSLESLASALAPFNEARAAMLGKTPLRPSTTRPDAIPSTKPEQQCSGRRCNRRRSLR